jgi:CHAT domain
LEILDTDSVLLDFVRVSAEDSDKANGFLVFVLPAGRPDLLQIVTLDDERSISEDVERLRADIQTGAGSPDHSFLWYNFWLPIEQAIEALRKLTDAGLRRLFVSMDGVLDWLPVQILRAPEWPWNKYLIDDYEISYLGAARDLLRTTIDIGARPLVLGLDHFDSDQEYGPSAEDITRSNRCQQPSFLPLANAEEEARRIGAKLDAEVWTGSNEVTKDRVMKRLEHIDQQIRDTTFRSPAILHIISHGFGLAPEQSSQQSDALLLSGLALSGAELWAPQLESGGQLPETHPGVLNAR